MAWKGIKNVTVIKTEADLLTRPDAPEPGPQTPAPAPEPKQSAESLAADLGDSHKKDELMAIAESLGLDSSGTKAEIALRIAEHQLSA